MRNRLEINQAQMLLTKVTPSVASIHDGESVSFTAVVAPHAAEAAVSPRLVDDDCRHVVRVVPRSCCRCTGRAAVVADEDPLLLREFLGEAAHLCWFQRNQ